MSGILRGLCFSLYSSQQLASLCEFSIGCKVWSCSEFGEWLADVSSNYIDVPDSCSFPLVLNSPSLEQIQHLSPFSVPSPRFAPTQPFTDLLCHTVPSCKDHLFTLSSADFLTPFKMKVRMIFPLLPMKICFEDAKVSARRIVRMVLFMGLIWKNVFQGFQNFSTDVQKGIRKLDVRDTSYGSSSISLFLLFLWTIFL